MRLRYRQPAARQATNFPGRTLIYTPDVDGHPAVTGVERFPYTVVNALFIQSPFSTNYKRDCDAHQGAP